jgi:hypothetical protein
MCSACGAYTVTATGGTTYEQSATMPDPLSSALRASASRDLPCESEDLDIRRLGPERQYAVTGCGARVSYRALSPTLASREIELVSRSPWPPVGNVASLAPASSDHLATSR